nr:MAG TPA: hypothetical protein [Caudoviricetes sp.]
MITMQISQGLHHLHLLFSTIILNSLKSTELNQD